MKSTEREYIIEKAGKINEIATYRERISITPIDLSIDHIDWNSFQEKTEIDMDEFLKAIKRELINKLDDKLSSIYLDMKNDLKKGTKEKK